jgi:phage recombination protein Bet
MDREMDAEKREERENMPELVPMPEWTPQQLKLITDVVAKGATKDELELFLYRCKNMGLDPLRPGQIYFIKYGNSPGTIVVGIEGFRSRAAKTGKLNGIKRGAIRDSKGDLLGAFAEVYRSDWKECAREEVPLKEYNTGKGNWAKMPETMIKKVAEAAALRLAFPDDLGGVYTQEELEQAEQPRYMGPDQPGPDDGDQTPSEWKFTFGKWNQKTVEQVYSDPKFGPDALKSYINFLEKSSRDKNEPLTPRALEAIQQIELFIGAMENAPLEKTNDGVPF